MKNINNQIEGIIASLEKPFLAEGVNYDKETNSFTFDFQHDNELSIISLENAGHAIEQFAHCYFYGYQFSENVDKKIRSEFIKKIKWPEAFEEEKDINLFIKKAVDYLDKKINIAKYQTIVYPQSMSELNRKMLSYLSRFTTAKYTEIELVKELPSRIVFDYNRFKTEVLDSYANGKPRYTEKTKSDALKKVEKMMSYIHQKDYFSIARDVKRAKFRQYISNYFIFKNKEDENLYKNLNNTNVLIIDDIVTSGTTIFHLLNTLRTVNDNNNIVVFSLIGKEI